MLSKEVRKSIDRMSNNIGLVTVLQREQSLKNIESTTVKNTKEDIKKHYNPSQSTLSTVRIISLNSENDPTSHRHDLRKYTCVEFEFIKNGKSSYSVQLFDQEVTRNHIIAGQLLMALWDQLEFHGDNTKELECDQCGNTLGLNELLTGDDIEDYINNLSIAINGRLCDSTEKRRVVEKG